MRVGIRLETEKGWHVYWKNPGDSGEPPQIHWQLPEGITAEPLQWPSPMRLKTSAGTDYGYEGNVVLLSALAIPNSIHPGSDLTIGGDLRWLVCRDTCMPQRASLSAKVRISNGTTIDNNAHTLLTSATDHLPKPLPDNLHLTAASSQNDLRLSFVSPSNIKNAEFFPAEPEQVDNDAPQGLAAKGGVIWLELKKSDHLQHDPERLKGLLVLDGYESYQLDVPIQNLTAHKEGK
jgi:thiol:disulfide interchange protein DsbD